MKAQDLQLTRLLEGSKQFIVPIFQRTYSWELKQCEQLWSDIVRVGSSDKLNSHFIGSAVYIPEEDTSAAISRWLVIDGQQRITTMALVLLALKNQLEAQSLDEPISPAQLEDSFLKNRYGKGDLAYKVLLTRTDKDTLIALIDEKEPPANPSQRLLENFDFFTQKVRKTELNVVYEGIQKLMIVDVRLQQGIDNPQMIFESMNSTGKALTQADLVRNYVLMGLEHDLQTRMYEEYWRPMEVEFGADNYVASFDDFMRFYLVVNAQNDKIRKDEVYDEFRSHAQKHDVEELLSSLRRYAKHYCRIALGGEPDADLEDAFHDIRELRVDVVYPLIMELYDDYARELLSKNDFLNIVRLAENYVFRRAICDIPTNSLRMTFATFTKNINKDDYLVSAKAAFMLFPSYRRFPKDDEFIRQIKVRNLYKFNRRSYWLRRYENNGRKERVPVQDYTIEHIMPQNENLSDDWKRDLGDDWQRVQEQYLHTLGNLTLTGYNSEYGDRPFLKKRDMDGGFAQSPLRLNEGIAACAVWNEEAINARADKLAKVAATIWYAPKLSENILGSYQSKKSKPANYSIDDHRHLQAGVSRELFDLLKAEVLALDECVSIDFRKKYVAFKAETNFVDVVPRAHILSLLVNLDFPEVDDPKGLCKDVTHLGRWGNGNVQISLSKKEDLSYVIGIVRQALDRQLGESEDD